MLERLSGSSPFFFSCFGCTSGPDRFLRQRHWKTNEVLGKIVRSAGPNKEYWQANFHRPDLLSAIAANVPLSCVHFNKQLAGIKVVEKDGSEVTRLVFEDGENVEADLVIGADGLRSVRDFPLGY